MFRVSEVSWVCCLGLRVKRVWGQKGVALKHAFVRIVSKKLLGDKLRGHELI